MWFVFIVIIEHLLWVSDADCCVVGSCQGEVVHWLACSLYAACRKGSTPTVGKGLMEGNCVSLTRILRTSKLRSATGDSFSVGMCLLQHCVFRQTCHTMFI